MALVNVHFEYNDAFTESCNVCKSEKKEVKAVYHVIFPAVDDQPKTETFLCDTHGVNLIKESKSYIRMIEDICKNKN